MNAIPPSFAADPAHAATQWTALAEAAGVVAALAGLEAERTEIAGDDLPALLRDARGWRRELAGNGVTDLAAIMEPGIAALLAINARGADPRPAARALWREYRAAREAILALLPPAA